MECVEKGQCDAARNAIRCVAYTKSQEDYNSKQEEMFNATNGQFKFYFLNNWETCTQMWASFRRDQYLHYGNATNNCLESHNQKLKDVTSHTSSLS